MVNFDYSINSHNISQILAKNFGYSIKADPLKKGEPLVELPADEAFSLSSIQGATYLVTPYGFSMRDRREVFIHRAIFQEGKYIYTPGLFGRNLEGYLQPGNSPREIFSKFPSLKNGTKKIIFRSSSGKNKSNIEKETFDELKKENIDPSDYMIFKISDNLTNIEPFFEFLSCKVFDKQGYFTESQTPWFQQSYEGLTGGIPDYSIFYVKEFDELKQKKLLPNFMIIQNLSSLFQWKGNHTTYDSDYVFSIGEVKSSKNYTKNALKQLEKYGKVGLADKLYATLYDETDIESKYGLINIGSDFLIRIKEPDTLTSPEKKLQQEDRKWIVDYAKMYLLANLPFEQITEFIIDATNSKKEKHKLESFDLLRAVHKTSFSEIVDLISAYM